MASPARSGTCPARASPPCLTRCATEDRGVTLAAVSGTFNTIHPDPKLRMAGLRRLRVLAEAAPRLGTSTITLSTGTRDPEDTWRHHPDNATPQAWRDLLDTLFEVLPEHRLCCSLVPQYCYLHMQPEEKPEGETELGHLHPDGGRPSASARLMEH
jgi:sugar phosphate isomerase/epimerase